MTVPIKLPKELDLFEQEVFPRELHSGKKVFINVLLKRIDKLKGLYYFYVFDKTSNIFRVTNYNGYCPDAVKANNGLFPLTIEYWTSKKMDSEEILQAAQRDLISMGICNHKDIVFIEITNKNNEFPTPTKEVMEFIESRYKILNSSFENLFFCGTFSNSDNFFLHENLKFAFNMVNKRVIK
jgi:protoporphyrinogen oxidase